MVTKMHNIGGRYLDNATCFMAFSICLIWFDILNPLRAFLYFVAIIIAALWFVILGVLLSIIIWTLIFFLIIKPILYFQCVKQCIISLQKFFQTLIEWLKNLPCIKQCILYLNTIFYFKWNINDHDNGDQLKNIRILFLMLSLIALLTFIGAFTVFILHISISSDHPTLDELTKSLIPKIILILIIWLLFHIFLNPKKAGKFWLLPKLYTDSINEMMKWMDDEDKKDSIEV